MAVPKYHELQKPFLLALADGNEHNIADIRKSISQHFTLTEDDLAEMYPNGKAYIFADRVNWAQLHIKKAGLIKSPARGIYVITEEGKNVLKEDPAVIDKKYLLRYDCYKEYVTPKHNSIENGDDSNEEKTSYEILEDAYSNYKREQLDEVMDKIMKISDTKFESLAVEVVAKAIFGEKEVNKVVTPPSNDNGIDGIISDKLNIEKFYIQAKKFANNNSVSRPLIDSFIGAIAMKSGKGIFVTTSKFTDGAIKRADENGIILIDGEKLLDLMYLNNLGMSENQTFEIKSIDTDYFEKFSD